MFGHLVGHSDVSLPFHAMEEELIETIRQFSLSDDPLSTATAQTFVDAFVPLSHAQHNKPELPSTPFKVFSSAARLRQARSTALLTLASRSSAASTSQPLLNSKDGSVKRKVADENLAQLLTPVIRSKLADTTPHSLLSALNFFSALFSVLPIEAHDILSADGIIDLVLEAPEACNALDRRVRGSSTTQRSSLAQLPPDEDLVRLAVAELLSSAANSTATRKYLAEQQAVLDWLDISCVPRTVGNLKDTDEKRKSNAIAVVAGLADIKIYRALASEAVQGLTQSAASQPTSQEDHTRSIQQSRLERKRKDDTLYQAVQGELLLVAPRHDASNASSSTEEAIWAEYRRAIQLGCLEVLAYLTVQPAFKERVATDSKLLTVLCTKFDIAASKQPDAQRGSLDLDSQRFDGALQLGLATILSNITACPPSLTAEEKEVKRLRKFASAQATKQDNGEVEEDEVLESISRVEQRCMAVLEAKGVEALTAIAVAGPPPSSNKSENDTRSSSATWKVNPSQSVRRACGDALLAVVTKQDRTMRGKAVQQGALKATLALSAPVLHTLAASKSNNGNAQETVSNSGRLFSRTQAPSSGELTTEDLAPLQALAKLLISLNPTLLFPSNDGLLSVASVICSLLLCPSASRLHKFEALLALTNLASLSPEIGLRIAAFSLESASQSEASDKNNDSPFSNTTVLSQACEQLLMEDHAMVRRAWIELLVNLLQVEQVFDYFVSAGSVPPSTSTDSSDVAGASDPQDRLSLRLRTLLGLSEVDEWAYTTRSVANAAEMSSSGANGAGGEASFATRMACLAILAMTTESNTVVNALMKLNRMFPVLLGNLVLDRSEDPERNDWERADLQPANLGPDRQPSDVEAEVQLNAINLSLRASYVLFNLLQHLQSSDSISSKGIGGFDKEVAQTTLQDALSYHVGKLKEGADPGHVEEARKGLLQMLAECLKVVRRIQI